MMLGKSYFFILLWVVFSGADYGQVTAVAPGDTTQSTLNTTDNASPPDASITGNAMEADPSNVTGGACDVNNTKLIAYYADWASSRLPPGNIPFNKLSYLFYAFATVEEDYLPSLGTTDLLKEVVSAAKSYNTPVVLSVGGWNGSKGISPMIADKSRRQAFIKKIVEWVDEYGLAGLDIDYEFPGRQAMTCTVVDVVNDTPNFFVFLKELRAALGSSKLLSLAVRVQPFDMNGSPMTNVSDIASTIDFINIMAYDMMSAGAPMFAPNAPLKSDPAHQSIFSVDQAATDWNNAGISKSNINIGLAAYGRSVYVSKDPVQSGTIYVPIDKSKGVPQGDDYDGPFAEPCPQAVKVYSGVWSYASLVKQNVLAPGERCGSGWECAVDAVSQTPYLYNPSTKICITYDDKASLAAKVDYIKKNGYGGGTLFALHHANDDLYEALSPLHSN